MNELKIVQIDDYAEDTNFIYERSLLLSDDNLDIWVTDNEFTNMLLEIGAKYVFEFDLAYYGLQRSNDDLYFNDYTKNTLIWKESSFCVGNYSFLSSQNAGLSQNGKYQLKINFINVTQMLKL